MRLLDDITDSMDMSLSKLREMVKDRGAGHAAVHEVTVKHNLASEQQQQPVFLPGKSHRQRSLEGYTP